MTTGDATWRDMRSAKIKKLLCPSDSGVGTYWTGANGGWERGNYGCNAAGIHGHSTPGLPGDAWGSTEGGTTPMNGWGWGGLPTTLKMGGVMCINWGTSLEALVYQDGSSNTIMLAELRIGAHLSPYDARGTWALGLPGASVVCGQSSWDTTIPNTQEWYADDCEGCINDPMGRMGAWPGCPFQQANSRSRHSTGVSVCFCDGSSRFVSNTVTQAIWWYMNGRNDGGQWDF